jgi:uncharacterized UPF0160 family protein
MPISLILTHPGGAHKDELLACSLLAAVHRAPIVRREPTEADLADPTIAVVDSVANTRPNGTTSTTINFLPTIRRCAR